MSLFSRIRKPFSTPKSDNGKLGTFGGVFVPSLLTILGVIMYLRFGWVVGNVGLLGTLLIVTLSTSITFLTSLSIAAISTDQVVKTGGAYYMISRSLGIETGGAVGIPLYLAQALSVALYVIGFAESVNEVFPFLHIKWVGISVTVLIALLALFSTQATIRTQYFILGAIALSLISLIMGKPLEETQVEMWGVPDSRSESFWVVFAVFFPAVTGIMAGVNLSGDLKNPSRSIPRGTFMAVGVGYVIYMILPVILASRADAITLVNEPFIMRRIAWWSDAILLGVWGATLSSAVGSILGAPRILQALAKDRVLPRYMQWLGKGRGRDNIPQAGTLLTMVVAIVAVYLGNLDIIAPVLSMFFLTTYGVLNIASGIETFVGSPSFRPSFRVHWFFSFLGAAGCLAVMLLINATATLVAAVFVSIVFIWLKRRGIQTAFGDVRRGIWMAIARSALLRVNRVADAKNWRPNILILSGAPTKRWHLISLGADFTGGRALMTVSTIIKDPNVSFRRLQKMENNIREFLLNRKVQALVRVVRAEDPFVGGERLVSMYGMGGLVPNTVMLGDTQEVSHHQAYCDMIRHFFQAKRNVIIVRAEEEEAFVEKKRIDLWWGGLNKNGGLMLLLAYLLQNSLNWQNVEVIVKMVVSDEGAVEKTRKNIDDIVHKMRVKFERKIIVSQGRSFWEILQDESNHADLVMLGLATPNDNFLNYYENLSEKTAHLPPTVFVLAAQELDFKGVLL